MAEFIRMSRQAGQLSPSMHDRLLAAYATGDVDTVAGLLLFSRSVDESFEGGGGPNLVRANAVAYVKAYWKRIGTLLAKAPKNPRSATRRNPTRAKRGRGRRRNPFDPMTGSLAPEGLSLAKEKWVGRRPTLTFRMSRKLTRLYDSNASTRKGIDRFLNSVTKSGAHVDLEGHSGLPWNSYSLYARVWPSGAPAESRAYW